MAGERLLVHLASLTDEASHRALLQEYLLDAPVIGASGKFTGVSVEVMEPALPLPSMTPLACPNCRMHQLCFLIKCSSDFLTVVTHQR